MAGQEELDARAVPGGDFIFDEYAESEKPIWGYGNRVAWQAGEPFMLTGLQGAGKSTLAQQLALRRAGIRDGPLLDLPVERLPQTKKALYLAMDRPRQIQRSLRRMVEESDRAALNQGLIIWRGPLSHLNVAQDPFALANWIDGQWGSEIGDVYIDSLKDLAPGLANDEVGAAVNTAIQELCARGMEVFSNHHNRKPQAGNRKPDKLPDVYGSLWLTAGHGSVIYLEGEAGAEHVELKHLKPVIEPIGPLHLVHDHTAGTTTAHSIQADVLMYVAGQGEHGANLDQIALACHGGNTEPFKAKARRQLEKLVKEGDLHIERGTSGGSGGGGKAARWYVR